MGFLIFPVLCPNCSYSGSPPGRTLCVYCSLLTKRFVLLYLHFDWKSWSSSGRCLCYLTRLKKWDAFILQTGAPVMGLFDASQQCPFVFWSVKGKIILHVASFIHVLHSQSITWNIPVFSKQVLPKWMCHQEMQNSRWSVRFSEIILSGFSPFCWTVSKQEVY